MKGKAEEMYRVCKQKAQTFWRRSKKDKRVRHIPSIDVLEAPLGARRALLTPVNSSKGTWRAGLAQSRARSVGKGARRAGRAVDAAGDVLVAAFGTTGAVWRREEGPVRAWRAEGAVG